MRNRWKAAWIGLLALLAAAEPAHAAVEPTAGARQVVAVFVDGMSFDDFAKLARYPHVNKWLKRAQYAAMSIRPPGPRSEANAYLLMGSGGPAVYSVGCGTAYHADEALATGETAGQRLAVVEAGPAEQAGSAAGQAGKLPGHIVFPGIFRLYAEQADQPFTARIGLLGSALRSRGLHVALYGNGDRGEDRRRNAALFAMDDAGRIPDGDISARANEKRPDAPYGVKTDYRYIAKQVQAHAAPGLIVVELADLARLYALSGEMSRQSFAVHYARVLADLDAFIGELLAAERPGRLVLLAAPAVNEQAREQKALLTPVVLWKAAGKSGLLTSGTTRQAGLVSGLDVLPTVLSWLSVPLPAGIAGHVMTAVGEKGEPPLGKITDGRAADAQTGGKAAGWHADGTAAQAWGASGMAGDQAEGERQPPAGALFDWFLAEVGRVHFLYRTRPAVLTAYISAQIFVLVAAVGVWLWGKREGKHAVPPVLCRTVRRSLLAMLSVPLLFLVEPVTGLALPPQALVAGILAAAYGIGIALDRLPLSTALIAISGGTAAGLLLDGCFGGKAISRSYLGYDPVIGARFYGLGNEYEGVLIGATILLAASIYERNRRAGRGQPLWASLAVFAFALYYMAAPQLGTDAGGFLAGMVGFGAALIRLQTWHVGKLGLPGIVAGLAAGIAVLIAVNLLSPYPLTHVGRAASSLVNGDWTEVTHMVERKIEMNLRVIRSSAWSRVFVVSLLAISLLSVRPNRYLRRMAERHLHLVNGFTGIIAGSVAGLCLNDSGIITAATCIVFFAAPALYAALAEQEGRPRAG